MASKYRCHLNLLVALHVCLSFGFQTDAACTPCKGKPGEDLRCEKPPYELPQDYAILPYQPSSVDCPLGYHAVFEHCYRLLNETVPGDAQNECEETNGTLAEVKDDVTNGAIYNFTESQNRGNQTIIGVYCKDDCTTDLKTHDNTSQTFTAWEKCEPNDIQYGKEKCVVTNFKRKAQWNNVRCYVTSSYTRKFKAICQVKGVCPGIKYADHGITFFQTEGGAMARSVENCTKGGFITSLPRATRSCGRYSSLTSFWGEVNITDCQSFPLEEAILEVTPDNVLETSEVLVNDNKGGSFVGQQTEEALKQITQIKNTTQEVTNNVVTVINEVIDELTYRRAGEEPTEEASVSNQNYVLYLETQLTNLQRRGIQANISTSNLEIMSFKFSDADGGIDLNIDEEDKTGGIEISFPPDLVESTTKNDDGFDDDKLVVTVIEYLNPVLFENEFTEQDNIRLSTNVFGIRVEGREVTNLPPNSPIKLTFPIIQEFQRGHANGSKTSNDRTSYTRLVHTCSFWDFELNEGKGGWSSDGCVTVYVGSDSVRCNCNHLTNLCVLVHETDNKALELINFIGCIISVLGLAITVLFFIFMRKIRTKLPQKILLNLSLALLGFYLAYLLGIQRRAMRDKILEEVVCLSSAAVIHYLVLASMAWMCVEAIHMYLLFVRVSKTTGSYFLCKAGMFAWGAPIIPVGVSIAVWNDNYIAESYCFLDWGQPLKLGFIPVILMMFIFNGVCYLRIFYRLVCSKEMGSSKDSWRVALFRIMNSVAIWTLLGMSWGFGFLSLLYFEISESKQVNIFDVLFSVTLSLNGFVIFLLFCVGNKEFREFWRRSYLRCCRHGKQTVDITIPVFHSTYSTEKATNFDGLTMSPSSQQTFSTEAHTATSRNSSRYS